jgi:hypothetical protein
VIGKGERYRSFASFASNTGINLSARLIAPLVDACCGSCPISAKNFFQSALVAELFGCR